MDHPDKNRNQDESGLGADGIPVLSTPVQYDSTGTSSPGTVIGDYRLVREIGRGSTAAVYLCEHIHSGKEYALKRLREGVVTDWHRKMLENEARLAGRLEHKNIAGIRAADPDSGYIVMEYVEGNSLDDYSSKETLLPIGVVVRVIKEVAEALNYSSRKNILHLDIKPGNIIVSGDFTRVKVMDFGCASIDGMRDDMLLIAGSINYMAPEQLIEGGKIDARADIYSLGAVFYRLVTGYVTYRTKDELSIPNVIRLITSKPHTPVFAYRHDIDADVEAIIDKMLVKTPENRYASWVDVILDLAKLSADLAKRVVEHSAIPAAPSKRPARIEQSQIDMIGECPLFNGLVESDLYDLILHSGLRKLSRYETLTSDGEAGDIFYVILQGGVIISKRGEMLREFHSGEIIGEEVCFADHQDRYCFSAKAMQDTSVLVIERSMRHLLGSAVSGRLNEALLRSLNIKLLRLDEYGIKGR